MKKYYVSFSGGTFVEAEDMDHAVEIAMKTVRNDVEATVYDVAENGDIGRKARGLNEKYKWIYVPLFLIAEFIACAIIISFIPFEIPIWLATCFGIEMGLLGFIVAVVLCK